MIKKINSIQDEELLVALEKWVNQVAEEEHVYQLSPQEQRALERSEMDYEQGKVITHEQLMDRIDQ